MMKVKYYKCPVCAKKFKTLSGWGGHMDTNHPDQRPAGYSTSRFFYYVMTGKTHGVCRTCKKDTPWNEGSMKYDQYCTNPECKKAYVKIAKSRMIGKYGKMHLLNDPKMQKKMLEHRRISGKYKFSDGTEFGYVGSYEKEFLKMMDTLMDWHTNDLISPSPHTYYYEYKNPKDDPKNEGTKFYIPDFYIPSLNLEIEIKQQTSTNKAMLDITRVKEKLKDEVLMSNKNVNYLKINDNDFTEFFKFLMTARENIPTQEELNHNQVTAVQESFSSPNDSYKEYFTGDMPKIIKRVSIIDNENRDNELVMTEDFLKPMRARSEMLIFNKDKIYVALQENDSFVSYKSLPGGGWDGSETSKEAAIREVKEEVRMNVKNVLDIGGTITTYDEPTECALERVPADRAWYGFYNCIFIAQYDGYYEGDIDEIDQDSLIKNAEWYPISEIYPKLSGIYRHAIDEYLSIYYQDKPIKTENPVRIAQEGLLSFLSKKKDADEFKTRSWMDIFNLKKNILGPGGRYIGARFVDGMIEIRGINYNLLNSRIVRHYEDKSINNIFLPKYNAMSYKRFKRKKIQRCQIKIDYLYTPEFFALELVNLFTELGNRFRDKVYLTMANQIYQNTWLYEADQKTITAPTLSTTRLGNISLQLNDYQKEFIEKYPKLKAQLNLNGYILAFEQGLGKTLTATALAECLNVDHVYIVCPNSLKENWALEIRKYYNKYSDEDLWRQEVFICSDKPALFDKNTTRFMIINNESIEKMFPYVLDGKNMLIVDESHNFRNIQSKRVQQLLELRDRLACTDTLIMSGTPIKATPDEIVPALMMIDPTFTDTAAKCFTKAFKLHSSLGTSLVQTRFGKIMYRKEKEVLGNTLPEKNIEQLEVRTSDSDLYLMSYVNEQVGKRFSELYDSGIRDAMKLRKPFLDVTKQFSYAYEEYDRFVMLIDEITRKETRLHEIDQIFVEKYMKDITARIKNTSLRHEYVSMIKGFVRFKAHCLGVAFGEILPKYRRNMFISMYEENKEMFFKMIRENTKKTLIFSQFKDVVNHIYADLNANDIGAVVITGDVRDRMSALREFKENDAIQVLVATSQTIGTGVTLIEASQMFFFGPPWRQSDFDQCSDRIHRIGQTDTVNIYTVVLSTPELNLSTRMDDILNWSKKMTESVISETDTDKENLEETNFEEILAQESYLDISTEGYVFSRKDTVYHLDDFENGKSNVLLITGLSRSGKSTLGSELALKYDAIWVAIDGFENFDVNFGVDDDELPWKDIRDAYLKTPMGKKYKQLVLKDDEEIMGDDISKYMRDCVQFILNYCEKDKENKYIIEGLQLYSDCDPSMLKKYPLIIKNTSMAKAYMRSRNQSYNRFKWYTEEEGKLKGFRQAMAMEGYFVSDKPRKFRLDDFAKGRDNILFVTGLSGGGKSTLAEQMANKYHAEWVELDWFENNNHMTDDQLKQCAEPLYIYLTQVPAGKRFREKSLSGEKITSQYYHTQCKMFGDWIIKYCEQHHSKKWVLEGVQIYSIFDLKKVVKHPMIILGTSMIKSIVRRKLRDGREGEFIKLCRWYMEEEKILNQFKSEVLVSANDTLIESERKAFEDFLGIEQSDVLNL